MGAWGVGPFDNDAAEDFLNQAARAPGEAVRDAFETATTVPYLDVDEAGAALAAAEIVALALGRGEPAKRKSVRDLLSVYQATEEDRVLALRALACVAESELADLWHEGKAGNAFEALLDGLHKRLGAS